ncbi:MAG TPA: hypothetical protein VMM83_06845 [Longimicrobiales bacterium]|nr:hypothetical protein [Longimicrobiales bacterium]
MSPALGAAILAAAWLACSLGAGAVLALLAKRIHPSLSLRRLWLFYSALLAVMVAAVLAIAWF